MKPFTLTFLIFFFFLFAGLNSCSSVVPKPDPPSVSVAGVKIAKLKWDEQVFELTLDLTNPNNFSLPLRGLNYAIQMNGEPFAKGFSDDSVTIAANDSAKIKLQVVSNLLKSLSQLSSFLQTGSETLDYSIEGNFGLLHNSLKLPFSKTGSVNLSPVR